MAEVCSTCGLPDELCVCEDVSKSDSEVSVEVVDRSYGKEVTMISGIPENINMDSLSTELKKEFACGGTTNEEEREIELQGNHIRRVKTYLEENGFSVEQ